MDSHVAFAYPCSPNLERSKELCMQQMMFAANELKIGRGLKLNGVLLTKKCTAMKNVLLHLEGQIEYCPECITDSSVGNGTPILWKYTLVIWVVTARRVCIAKVMFRARMCLQSTVKICK